MLSFKCAKRERHKSRKKSCKVKNDCSEYHDIKKFDREGVSMDATVIATLLTLAMLTLIIVAIAALLYGVFLAIFSKL
jgi:hypothetical protein